MTDPGTHDDTSADAQRARVEALRQRRVPRVDSATTPAVATGAAPRRARRRHPASRSRVGVAALSVATMLGLVGVMGLARPTGAATPSAPGGTIAEPRPVPTVAHPPAAPTSPGEAVAAPPVVLTARPSVQVTNPTTAAPIARSSGSH